MGHEDRGAWDWEGVPSQPVPVRLTQDDPLEATQPLPHVDALRKRQAIAERLLRRVENIHTDRPHIRDQQFASCVRLALRELQK